MSLGSPEMTAKQITFFARLASTLGLWILVLATIFLGYDTGFFCLIAVMALIALWEYYRMLEGDGIGVFTLTGLACAAVLLAGGFLIMRGDGPENAYGESLGTALSSEQSQTHGCRMINS